MTITLRAAIVGAGRIAGIYDDEVTSKRPREFFQGENRHAGLYTIHPVNHADAYRTTPGYELVAVVGRGRERLDAFRDRWQVQAFDDLEAMLTDMRPDVVSVCVQSAQKADITVRIARAGTGVRAIIVEKAMATSMAETDAMIAACEAAGIRLIVNHPYRFSPVVREARTRIDAGEIGEIGTLGGWSRGGVIHGGTHTFDLLRYFGGDIEEITAWGGSDEVWADRGATAMLRFASGAVGFVSLERNAMAGFDIRGSSGAIEITPHVGESWIVRLSPLDPDSRRAYPMTAKRSPIGTTPPELSTTQRLLAEVRDALLDGAPIVSSGRDGAAALEAGIATLISARTGTPISLPLATDLRSISIPNR